MPHHTAQRSAAIAERIASRPDILAILKEQGYRVTAPRRRIVDLLDKKDGSFTVEEIACDLPKVGRATVYRTIKMLVDTGVVCKLMLPDGTPKYNIDQVEHHHHTVCVKCGKVGEFSATTIERLIRSIGKEISGDIVGHRMEFYTVCEACPNAQN